eukprot:11765151-Prorocentrum_lima.AAC.1
MTSSLVGSEMCIRDSPKVALVTPLPRTVNAPSNTDLGVFTSCVEEGIMSVSYTHLTLPTICSV